MKTIMSPKEPRLSIKCPTSDGEGYPTVCQTVKKNGSSEALSSTHSTPPQLSQIKIKDFLLSLSQQQASPMSGAETSVRTPAPGSGGSMEGGSFLRNKSPHLAVWLVQRSGHFHDWEANLGQNLEVVRGALLILSAWKYMEFTLRCEAIAG